MKVSNFQLGICVPLSHHMIPSAFFDSFIAMEKPSFNYYRTSNGPIDEMRNNLVREALGDGCTHILMCDTDQCYHPKTVTRLLSRNLPIVGALVFRRYPPFDPLMLSGTLGKYKTIEEWEKDSLVEVDATGTGCVLFDAQVFRKMPPPWFRARRSPVDWRPIGEDIGFCSDLRAAGYRIFVDTSVPAGHLSQIQVMEGTWRLHRKISEAQAHAVEHEVLTIR